MSRANALRILARSDPEAFVQAALDVGVLEHAGWALGGQLWPEPGGERLQAYQAGPALAEASRPEPKPTKGEGSDCPTGKAQYSKEGAREERDRHRAMGDATMHAFACQTGCGLWHVGHRRRADKKAAMGRRR